MIQTEKIREILTTWEHDIRRTTIFQRDALSELTENFGKKLPIVLHGIRRSGKTYLMYQLFKNCADACYLNFEDERLMGISATDLDKIYVVYIGMKSPERPVMFLDEIQNVKGWEKFVSRLYEKVKFIISGSNATLLSSEYATALTGRHIPMMIYPLSFTEYILAEGKENLNPDVTEQKAILTASLFDYTNFGGFPEASLQQDGKLIKTYFDSILFRDIIPRFGIQHVASLEMLARYLASNPGKFVSYRNLCSLVSIKHEDTIKNYISYMEKAYLFSTVLKFDFSLRKQMANQKKIYPADTGFSRFAGSSFSEERGRLLEIIIYNELKKRGFDIFYWKNERGKEVDFIVCQGLVPKQIIQVSETIINEGQLKRETEPLLLASEAFKVTNLLLLTLETVNFQMPQNIRNQSVLQWLLNENCK